MSDDENFPLATDRPQAQARQVEAEFNENQENIQNVENQENNVENESTVKTFESKTKLKVHFKECLIDQNHENRFHSTNMSNDICKKRTR